MTKNKTLTLGVLTALPLFFIFCCLLALYADPLSKLVGQNFQAALEVFIGTACLLFVLRIVLTIIYVLDVSKNRSVEVDKNGLWSFLIIFGGTLILLIYWYRHLWKQWTISEACLHCHQQKYLAEYICPFCGKSAEQNDHLTEIEAMPRINTPLPEKYSLQCPFCKRKFSIDKSPDIFKKERCRYCKKVITQKNALFE